MQSSLAGVGQCAPQTGRKKKRPPTAGGLGVVGGEEGIARPIHGPHPFALRAAGPACGCPHSLQTSASTLGSHPTSSPGNKKRPIRGVPCFWRRGRDCSAHPWASPLRALRSGASLRLSAFAPDECVEPWVLTRHRPPETRNAPFGAFLVSGGEGGIRTLGTLARTPDFESGTFDHSATSPVGCESARAGKCTRWPVARQAWPPRVPAGVVCFQPAFFLASRSHVSTTVSGFRDNDSMPCSISHSARSG